MFSFFFISLASFPYLLMFLSSREQSNNPRELLVVYIIVANPVKFVAYCNARPNKKTADFQRELAVSTGIGG
jgi:hypothetical protein